MRSPACATVSNSISCPRARDPGSRRRRDKRLAALIAVDGSGSAAIKGLLIDGRLQYEERLL